MLRALLRARTYCIEYLLHGVNERDTIDVVKNTLEVKLDKQFLSAMGNRQSESIGGIDS